jgi:hypothetical protein
VGNSLILQHENPEVFDMLTAVARQKEVRGADRDPSLPPFVLITVRS